MTKWSVELAARYYAPDGLGLEGPRAAEIIHLEMPRLKGANPLWHVGELEFHSWAEMVAFFQGGLGNEAVITLISDDGMDILLDVYGPWAA